MTKFDMFLHAHLTLDESVKFISGCKYKQVNKHSAKALHEWLTFQRLGSVSYDDGILLITLPWEGAHHISIWFEKGKKGIDVLISELEKNRDKCMVAMDKFRNEED